MRGRRACPRATDVVTLRTPYGFSFADWSAASPSSTSRIAISQCRKYFSPASVIRSLRVVRWIRRAPSRFSSPATFALTVVLGIPKRLAVAEKLPDSTTFTNTAIASMTIVQNCAQYFLIFPPSGQFAKLVDVESRAALRSLRQALIKRGNAMTIIKTLAIAAAGTVLATSAFAQSAREIRGASPYVAIENEPAPKLIVDPPLPDALAQGVFWAQYRAENVRIVQVFGAGARQVSPRVGHLHINVDDLPWWWADASDNNTIDIAGLPPGQHKVKIDLVDADHNVFPGQVVTVNFTVPASANKEAHRH